MKSLCGNGKPIQQGVLTAEEAMRYVLSLPVSTLVSGIDSREVLRQNIAIARRFVPMTQEEMLQLRRRVSVMRQKGNLNIIRPMHSGPVIGMKSSAAMAVSRRHSGGQAQRVM